MKRLEQEAAHQRRDGVSDEPHSIGFTAYLRRHAVARREGLQHKQLARAHDTNTCTRVVDVEEFACGEEAPGRHVQWTVEQLDAFSARSTDTGGGRWRGEQHGWCDRRGDAERLVVA